MNDFEYLEELERIRAINRDRFHSDEQNRSILKEIGRKEEPEYTGSTYLYIKSSEDDEGNRPLPPETIFWHRWWPFDTGFWGSPAIILYDDNHSKLVSSRLIVRTEYVVQVIVTNAGDHDCHSATVELLLSDPSIEFSRASTTQIGIQNINVPGHSDVSIEFPFSVDRKDSGRRYLFARTYSFGTNDYPLDFENLSPLIDRHVAHQYVVIGERRYPI